MSLGQDDKLDSFIESIKSPSAMITTATARGDRRLNGLDHLRAFAIAYVFLIHYSTIFFHPRWLEPIGEFGWTGVDLFFVLSGYLIGGQLLRSMADKRPISISDFYIKRFFRIIPVYLIALALYSMVPALREVIGMQPPWRFLTFTENFAFDGRMGRAFSHAWSLCVEEHFYLVFPLLIVSLVALDLGRKAIWIAAVVFVGGIAIRMSLWDVLVVTNQNFDAWYKWIYYPTYSRLDGLLMGVCAAALQCFVPEIWSRLTRWPNLLIALGVAVLMAAYRLCQDRTGFIASAFSFPLVSIGYGLVLIAAVSPSSFLYRVGLKASALLATLSYSLYLVHKMTIHITQTLLSKMHANVEGTPAFLLCIATAIAAAWVLHASVERPFMNVRSIVLTRRKRRANSVAVGEFSAK